MDLTTLIGPSELSTVGLMGTELLSTEPWRAVTSLTLHADQQHLISNAASLGIFSLLLSRRTGLGVTVFVAVAGGALGNALDAWLLAPASHWVGASTAVFAVLGAACAAYRSLMLTIAAIVLVIVTHAENVNTGAHALGLVAGIVMGLLVRTDDDEPAGASAQLLAGTAGFAAIAACWSLAMG